MNQYVQLYTHYSTELFSDYARTFSALELKTRSNGTLPLSNTQFPRTPVAAPAASLIEQLTTSALPVDTRSLFVANSGHSDDFTSMRDLLDTVRDDVVLQREHMPSPVREDRFGKPLQLNSYVTDFFNHGQISLLHTENGFPYPMAWQLLKDWQLLLQSLLTALIDVGGATALVTFIYVLCCVAP
jgi:hypothetical protein